MTARPVMIALDPSITAFGWAALPLDCDEAEIVAAGVLETKLPPKAKRALVCEEDARRVRFLHRELAAILRAHRPVVVAIELAGGAKSAKAAKALAQAQTIATIVVDLALDQGRAIYINALEGGDAVGLQPTQRVTRAKAVAPATPEEAAAAAKKASRDAGKRRKDRKTAIGRAVVDRFGVHAWVRALGLPGGTEASVLAARWEGAHDAAAVGLAAWERPEVAAIRAFARRTNDHQPGGTSAEGMAV